jgi:hypothetical protein
LESLKQPLKAIAINTGYQLGPACRKKRRRNDLANHCGVVLQQEKPATKILAAGFVSSGRALQGCDGLCRAG